MTRASLFLALTLAACSGGPSQSSVGSLPPQSEVDIGEVIAEVGGFPIGSREFEAAAARVAPANGDSFTDEEKREILDDLVTEKMLYLHARALGVDRDPKVQKVMVNTLLRERVYAEVRNSDFTEEQLQAYFDSHSDEFIVPAKLQVLRIFIRSGRDRTDEEAKALADDLYSRVATDAERFKPLAMEHSEDPYRRRGGDLGFMSREGKPGIDPEVVARAFEMAVGDVSEPFEAGGGYNIIMISAKRDQVERTFAQMKGSVLRKVKAQHYRELYEGYVSGIQGEYSVDVNDSALSGLNPRPGRLRPGDDRPGVPSLPGMDDEGEDEGPGELE